MKNFSSGTGDNPYYHDPCYEPLWAVCEELDMPVHTHSGWSFDYGDGPAATAMFISEVAWFAHRPFTCFLWAGVFEREGLGLDPRKWSGLWTYAQEEKTKGARMAGGG